MEIFIQILLLAVGFVMLVNRRHHRLLLLRAERVEKNKGKHLSFKCLPRILLIFSIQGLFLYSSLRRCQTCDRHAEWRA